MLRPFYYMTSCREHLWENDRSDLEWRSNALITLLPSIPYKTCVWHAYSLGIAFIFLSFLGNYTLIIGVTPILLYDSCVGHLSNIDRFFMEWRNNTLMPSLPSMTGAIHSELLSSFVFSRKFLSCQRRRQKDIHLPTWPTETPEMTFSLMDNLDG